MNTKAHDRMQAAEVMYLLENGWRRLPNTTPDGSVLWTGLSDKYSHGVTQGHAVNAQKQYDCVSPMHPPTRRLVVEVTDKGAVHYEQMTRDDAHKFLDEYPLGCEYKEHLLRADLEAKAQKDCADDLAKELLERNKQLSDTEADLATERTRWRQEHKELVAQLRETKIELEKSRAYSKNREAERAECAECAAKAAQLHTEVCLERNKLRSLNKDLTAELGKHKSRCKELLAQLEESEKSEATLRDQLEESRKIEAELRA